MVPKKLNIRIYGSDAGTLTVGLVDNVEILQQCWDVVYEFIVFLTRGRAKYIGHMREL